MLDKNHLINLLKAQVEKSPSKISLVNYDRDNLQLTNSELDLKTDKIAQILIEEDIKEQDNVAIFASNSVQWIMADIAIMKARAVVIPLNSALTEEHLIHIINETETKIIFVDSIKEYEIITSIMQKCPCIKKLIIFDNEVKKSSPHFYLDNILGLELKDSSLLVERLSSIKLDDVFAIIYTSGTTGDPKGVMLDHRSLAYSMEAHLDKFGSLCGEVSLGFLPLAHIFEHAWSLHMLAQGGCNFYLNNTSMILKALEEVRPNYLCSIPRLLEKIYNSTQDLCKKSFIQMKVFNWANKVGYRYSSIQKHSMILNLKWFIANKLVFSKLKKVMGGRIKFIACGGAGLDVEVDQFFKNFNIPIMCGYGMTETIATLTCNTIADKKVGTVGKPLSNLQIKIGEQDEILVKGDTLMRGYYKKPEDTKAVFTEGWFKTGDCGKFDEDGNLVITDRIKELMKTSNGKYIAPQRVEGKIICSSLIEQVAIVAEQRSYVTALIVPNYIALKTWAQENNVQYSMIQDLLKNAKVIELFNNLLTQLQCSLSNFEQVKKFTLLLEAFSIEKNLITPTLKLKRKNIYNKYASEIESMYKGN